MLPFRSPAVREPPAMHAPPRRPFFALIVVAAFTPASALAAARIGVMPFAPLAGDVPQGAGERGADILQKELKNQSDFEVIPRQEVASNTAAKALSLANTKLQEARTLVGQHKAAAAVKAYQAALDAFGKGAAELENFEDVLAADQELATLLYRDGKDDDAAKVVVDAMRLSAGQSLRTLAASPTFATIMEGLDKKATTMPKGACRVDSVPQGADVYVDGQAAGKTPVLLKDLPAGKHYVRALLPSGEKWGELVDVPGKGEVRVRAHSGAEGPVAEVSAQLVENQLQQTALPALKQAAATQKVAFLAFGVLHRTPNGLALDPFLYSAERGTVSRLQRVGFDAEMLEAGLEMDKVVADIQKKLGGDPTPVSLPSKVALDMGRERDLATEYHFGGVPDATIDQPAGGAAESDEESGHRVIHKHNNP
jgi:hypothetical protein